MSKIYEALQRAELERAARTGSNGNGSQAAETALANVLDDYVPEPQPHFDEMIPSWPPAEPEIAPAGEWAALSSAAFSPVATPTITAPPATTPPSYAYAPASTPSHAAPNTPSYTPPSTAGYATSSYAPARVQAPASPAVVTPQPQYQPPPAESTDPGGFRVIQWHPVIERLPALTERGRSVEQFRSLRSRLAEFRDSSVPLKSLLITSGLPQEGKSFIAANLALSLSRHRANRVLLIDADIRRSSLHAMFGAPAEPGLTDYLSGRAELAEVLQRCQTEEPEPAFHNGLSSLTFLPGGSEPDKAADLSGSPRFAEMLEQLGPHFDWIVIDSSPVNLVSDGVNFARACDGVMLVAREGVTKFETAQNAQQQLKSARILGFVLNAVHTASAKTDEYNYGPYGTYGSYGGYGYSTTKR